MSFKSKKRTKILSALLASLSAVSGVKSKAN